MALRLHPPLVAHLAAGTLAVWLTAAATGADTHGGDDDDAAALALPSTAPTAGATMSSLNLIGEAAYTEAAIHPGSEGNPGTQGNSGGGYGDAQRVSLEIRDDVTLRPGLRFVFGDRLDTDFSGRWDSIDKINTLKQAFLTWQPQNDLLLDTGRINARQGVAFGYNPTDFLRADALRTVDSLDPDSLRDERLGTVMLRGQTLWDGGSLTAAYAPKLARAPTDAAFNPDFGATNSAGRWLLSATERLGANWSPQWLLFGTDRGMPQVGLDTTALLGDATVVYVEASGGGLPSLYTQAENLAADPALRVRAATGLTVTLPKKLALTVEYEYDGAALNARGWNALRSGDPERYGLYRNYVAAQQELPTRQAVFAYASWQDIGIRHLDWSAFLRLDLIDRSRLPWTELRYHFSHTDLALRWQDEIGAVTSDYGAAPTGRTWQFLADDYW